MIVNFQKKKKICYLVLFLGVLKEDKHVNLTLVPKRAIKPSNNNDNLVCFKLLKTE